MTEKEAIYILRNAVWLGSDVDRQKVEEAVEVVANAIEAQDMTLYMNLPEVSVEEAVEILKRNNRIELLPSGKDTNVPSKDCIDRAEAQTAIQFAARRYTVAHEAHGEGHVVWSDNLISVTDAMNALREVPPAHSDVSDTNVGDMISRQAAINAINTWDKFGVDERSRVVRWHEGLEPYVHLRDVVAAIGNLPPSQPERIQNNAVHLCDSCQYTYVTCPSHGNDAVFGDGKGNDNICACNKYRPISAQPERKKGTYTVSGENAEWYCWYATCNECGKEWMGSRNFCPHCGYKMER